MSKREPYRPIPYDEDKDPDKFWPEDSFDEYLPKQKGFISDLVYSKRGTELPTIHTTWAALLTLAAVVKREAWVNFGPIGRLYTNFYLLLVGPPYFAHKSENVNIVTELIGRELGDGEYTGYRRHVSNEDILLFKNELKVFKDKITAEALVSNMVPKSRRVRISTGDYYQRTSETVIIVSELATMLGKEKYNEGLINLLTDIYTTKKSHEVKTIGRGDDILGPLHTCLIGAITNKAFGTNIPASARGDGFLSRTVIAMDEGDSRSFAIPRYVPNAPDMEELKRRLAWIAENALGEYKLTKEAFSYYNRWYHQRRAALLEDPEAQGAMARVFILFLKIALLIHIQAYKNSNEIDLQDVKDAELLLEKTMERTPDLLFDTGGGEGVQRTRSIEKYIKSKGEKGINRRAIAQNKHVKAAELLASLRQLYREGKIKVFKKDGTESNKVANKTDEIYVYVEKEDKDVTTIEAQPEED